MEEEAMEDVFRNIDKLGYLAGAILIAAGLFRVGAWIKYIPEPVVTGFTAGIAVMMCPITMKSARLFAWKSGGGRNCST